MRTIRVLGILLLALPFSYSLAFTVSKLSDDYKESDCVDFEGIDPGINYSLEITPGELFFHESDVRVYLEEYNGRYELAEVRNDSGCDQPDVSQGQYLFLDAAVTLDFQELIYQPTLLIFNISHECGQSFRVRSNQGPFVDINAADVFEQIISLGVHMTYQAGSVIIEGPLEQLYIGGAGIGMDLVCFERSSDSCSLRDMVIEAFDCTDSSYLVHVDFLHDQPGMDSFSVIVFDSLIGKFIYDSLPLTLGPLSVNCEHPLEVLVRDLSDTTCQILKSIPPPCCPSCEINDLSVEVLECLPDSMLSVRINFHPSEKRSEQFDLYTRGNAFLGTFTYSSLPLVFNQFPMSGNDFELLRVCDREFPDCCASIEFEAPVCPTECGILELRYELSDCDSDSFLVFLQFDTIGQLSDSFIVRGNGHLWGTFPYTEEVITLGPFSGDCETVYEFVVIDSENEECRKAIEIGKVCCDEHCRIEELRYERSRCENDSFYVHVNFNVQNPASGRFYVAGNGRREGPFEYSQLPVRLGPYPGDCETPYEFVVIDSENEECRKAFEIGKVCCDEHCRIEELRYERSRCENDSFYVHVNFTIQNPASDRFYVAGNGRREGPFEYSQLPIRLGPYPGDCETAYEFVVIDSENEECRKVFEIGKVCCNEECRLSELRAEVISCLTDSTYTVQIDFEYEGLNNPGYDIYTRNGFWAFIRSHPPFKLLDFPKSGNEFDLIKICANDKPDCCVLIELESPDCSALSTQEKTTNPRVHYFWVGQDLNITVEGDDVYTIQFYGLGGQLIRSGNIAFSGETIAWDLGYLPAGVYFLRIHGAKNFQTFKIMKAE